MTGSATRTSGMLAVVAAAVLVSMANVMAPIVYAAGSNPVTYLALRFLCFAILCRLWFWLRRRDCGLPRRRRLAAYGIGATFALGVGALLGAFAFIPVSLAVLILYMFPLLTVLYAALLDRRPPALRDIGFVLVAFVGIGLALKVAPSALNGIGVGLAILAAITVSAAYVWNDRTMADLDTTVVTFHMSVGGLLAAGVLGLVLGPFALPAADPASWAALVVAVTCFAGSFFLMFFGLRLIGAVDTAMILNLEPVATIGLALIILGERLAPLQLAGAGLVVGAVVFAQATRRAASG